MADGDSLAELGISDEDNDLSAAGDADVEEDCASLDEYVAKLNYKVELLDKDNLERVIAMIFFQMSPVD